MSAEATYEKYSNWLISLIPPGDWKWAVLNIIIQPGSLRMNGQATYADEKTASLRTKVTQEVQEEIIALHDLTTDNGANKWNKLTLTVYPDGQYTAEPFWDQVHQDEIDKLNNEARRSNPSYELPKWKWES